ncbi:MAG: biotin transporter BioY [Clostridia bacterium]|nr:biotin transporter BioY [Clostridia bacterium]
MTKIALCIAVLCVSSYLIIPLPFTPVVLTLHSLAVNIIGLILKPKYAAYTVLIYLIMGLIGLPVFSGGTSGAGKLFGPTGGYYFGFLFAVIVISLLKGKYNKLCRYIVVTIGIGIPVQHMFAVLIMCCHNGFNLTAAILSVSVPFIPGDIIKAVVASVTGNALNKYFDNNKKVDL